MQRIIAARLPQDAQFAANRAHPAPGFAMRRAYAVTMAKGTATPLWRDAMKTTTLIFVAVVMPFGFFVVAGVLAKRMLEAYRRRHTLPAGVASH